MSPILLLVNRTAKVLRHKDHAVIAFCLFFRLCCRKSHSLPLDSVRAEHGWKTTLGEEPGQQCSCPVARVQVPTAPPAWPSPGAVQGQDGGECSAGTGEMPLLLAIVLKGDAAKLMFDWFFFQTLTGNQGISSEYSFSSLFLFLPQKKNHPEPNSKKSNEILTWKHFFLVHFNSLSVRIQFCRQVSMAS